MAERELFPLRSGLWHLGRFSEKEAELRAMAERDPKAGGLALFAQGRFEEAEPVLRWAAELHPESFEVQLTLGRALLQASRWREAAPYFEQAVKLQPDSYEAHYWFGESLLKEGCFAQAAEHFSTIAKKQPLRTQVWWKWVALRRWLGRGPAETAALEVSTVNPEGNDARAKLKFASLRRDIIAHARSRVAQLPEPNPAWSRAERGRRLTVRNTPIVRRGMKIFTMGSCFALEIRHELSRQGFVVYPKYFDIAFDTRRQVLDSLPDRDNINHYDTFTIRQEVEMAFADQKLGPPDFWEISNRPINKVMHAEKVYQDPCRKNVYATDPAGILEASHKIGQAVQDGLMAADVYVFTLGLIETWVNPTNGRPVCAYPGVGGGGGTDGQAVLHVSTFAENYANMKRVCELLLQRFPEKQIILTVSPVALERTFRPMDIVVANIESKALLRAVAGQICQDFPQVHYLPAYELFLYHDLFHDNGRHATREGVEIVFQLFAKAFLVPEGESAEKSEAD